MLFEVICTQLSFFLICFYIFNIFLFLPLSNLCFFGWPQHPHKDGVSMISDVECHCFPLVLRLLLTHNNALSVLADSFALRSILRGNSCCQFLAAGRGKCQPCKQGRENCLRGCKFVPVMHFYTIQSTHAFRNSLPSLTKIHVLCNCKFHTYRKRFTP